MSFDIFSFLQADLLFCFFHTHTIYNSNTSVCHPINACVLITKSPSANVLHPQVTALLSCSHQHTHSWAEQGATAREYSMSAFTGVWGWINRVIWQQAATHTHKLESSDITFPESGSNCTMHHMRDDIERRPSLTIKLPTQSLFHFWSLHFS